MAGPALIKMGWLSTQSDAVWRLSVAVASISFLAMALAAIYFLYRRRNVQYRAAAVVFVLALLGASVTRASLASHGVPPLTAALRTATVLNGLFSLAMAIVIVGMMPAGLKMASRKELESMNRSLREEVEARHRVEEQLRGLAQSERLASEATLRSYFEAASQGVIVVSREGRILLINRRVEEMFGYAREELLGRELETLLPPRYRQIHTVHRHDFFLEPSARAMGAGRELNARRKDGSEFPIEIGLSYVESPQGTTALGLVSDITERRRAADELRKSHAELRASEGQLRSYLEAAAQAIVAISEDGRIVLVNQRTEEIFGYGRQELLGQPLEILLPERYRQGHVAHRSRFFSEPRVRPMGAGLELAGRRKDGTEFPLEIGLSFVETDQGALSLGLVTDITERKRVADELAALNEELRRSNVELEQFAYIASHDLQEPLRMVTSYLNLLEVRYRGRLDEDAAEFIRYAVDGAERMKGLIRDVLRFSRAGTRAVMLEDVPATDVVELALANLQVAIEERGAMVSVGSLPRILADPNMLTHVFQNLIGNAIKFTKRATPQIQVSAERRRTEWVFSVRDNGIGIDPRHIERIFTIFERLNPSEEYPGTGVGLAVCKKIVERHHGRIWVESQPGEGSVFHFSLPVDTRASPQEKSAASV